MQTHPNPASAEAPVSREARLAAYRAETLSRYPLPQQEAALRLYHLAKRHLGTGGGNAAAKLLIGLYNGTRFPFDLTDLRRFDPANFEAAMIVLRMDACQTWCEIHVLLDAIRGPHANTGAEFENWAYDLKLRGRCKKEALPQMPTDLLPA